MLVLPKELDVDYLKEHPEVGKLPADVSDFVSSLVMASHEYQHVKHYLVDIEQDHDPVKFVEYAALSGNYVYYIQNYFKWSTDAECQYRGLYETYGYLVGLSGSHETAERLVLDYQSDRFDKAGERTKDGHVVGRKDFIPVPEGPDGNYGSVEELFGAYERACVDLVHARKEYDYKLGRNMGDVAGLFFWGYSPDDKSAPADRFRRLDRYEQFSKEQDGFSQSKMVASMNPKLRLDKNDEIGRIKRLFGLDMRLTATFGLLRVGDRVRRVKDLLQSGHDVAGSCFGDIVTGKSDGDDGPSGPGE